MPTKHLKSGEVVIANTSHFTGQSYQLNHAPVLGSGVYVEVDGAKVLGVVYDIRTESLDPSRTPMTLGSETTDLAQILRDQPQLNALLKTQFEVRTVGFNDKPYLPPAPAPLHAGIHDASSELFNQLGNGSYSYLKNLIDLPGEILAAHIRWVTDAANDKLVEVGQSLSVYLKDDPAKLSEVLEKLE